MARTDRKPPRVLTVKLSRASAFYDPEGRVVRDKDSDYARTLLKRHKDLLKEKPDAD